MPQASRLPGTRRHGATGRNIAAIAFALQVSAAAAQTSSADQIIAQAHAAFRAAKSASVLDSLETLCRANLSLIFLPKRDRLVIEAIDLIHENKFKEANDAFLRIGDLESDLDSRKKACHPSPEEAQRATAPRDDASAAPPQAPAPDMNHSDPPGSPAPATALETAKAAIPTEAASGSQSQDPALAMKGEEAKPAQEAARPAPSVAEDDPIAASSAQPAAAPAPASSAATGPDGGRPSRGQRAHDTAYDFSYLPPPNEPSPQPPLASTPEAPSAPPTSSPPDSAASAKRASVDAATPLGSGFGENAPPPSDGSATNSAPRDEAAPVQPAAPMRYDFAQIEGTGVASPSPAEPSADVSTRLEPPPEIAAPQEHAQPADDRSAGSPVAAPPNSAADAPSPSGLPPEPAETPTYGGDEAKPPHGDAAPPAPAKLSDAAEATPARAATGPGEPSPDASGKAFAGAGERNSTTGSLSSTPAPAAPVSTFSNRPPEDASAAELAPSASALARPQGAAAENAPAGSTPSQAMAPAAMTGAVPQAEATGKLGVDEALQQPAKENLAAASSITSSKASAESPVLATAPQPIEGAPIDKLEPDRPPLTADEPSPFTTRPDRAKERLAAAVPDIEARPLASWPGAAAQVARAFTNLSTLAAARLSQAASDAARSLIAATQIEERAATRELPAPTISPPEGEASIAARRTIAPPPEWSASERTASAEDGMSISQEKADSSFARSEGTRRPRAASRASRATAAYHALRTRSPTAGVTAKLAVGARAIDKPEDRHSSRPRYGQAAGEKKANSVPVRARVAASQGHEPSALPGMLRRRCPTILASGDEYDDELVSFCAQWANAIE